MCSYELHVVVSKKMLFSVQFFPLFKRNFCIQSVFNSLIPVEQEVHFYTVELLFILRIHMGLKDTEGIHGGETH